MSHPRTVLPGIRGISAVVFSAVIGAVSPVFAAPELIVINADVRTVDPQAPRVEAFAVEGRRFSAVGSTAEIRALADSSTQIIDAAGRTVTPGFIDSHSHMDGNAPVVAGVDLAYVEDKAQWLRLIREADERLPEGEWLTGGYWDHTLSDGEYPTRQMLDAVVPDRPIFLTHIDGHYAWVNSLALEMTAVTADTPVPAGGEIIVDPVSRAPTGILLEGAMSVVRDHIPPRSDARRREGLEQMQRYANSFGITGLHQMRGLDDYLHIVETGDPSLRVWYGHFGLDMNPETWDETLDTVLQVSEDTEERVAATKKEDRTGPLLQAGFVKLINDGVLSAHTAVLMEDYHDRPNWRGEYITEPDDLTDLVYRTTARGLPVAIHSIGDAAVSAALDAIEASQDNTVGLPNRIEHIELLHPDDVPRFRELGVVASMQPNHCTNAIGYVPARVGEEREDRAYVWQTLLDGGAHLVFGADYPTSPLSPLTQLSDAVFRESPFGFNNGRPWHPEESVNFDDALHAYTQAGADITPWKDDIGSISVGKWADFVVLSGQVPEPMDESFRALVVDHTYFAGREVYARLRTPAGL
ncbi:amidohydrolase [Congregibacter litoralis]|uniref:Putative metal-dependent hydrolase with the TIM-barrel fold protein n=1 Tax=Congregibacter litoralis KT71 TaxID=314285 RepID=A4A747_9GAMM|nr:amidohydrolase [Congregibacter litoralis]EAQ98116.2 putative metal-dependent hydrolase with the TIM-barrel fold protein [Congregibacter litoralis KT71]